MVDLREQTKQYEAWWRRENERPLVNSYFPNPLPHVGLDLHFQCEDAGQAETLYRQIKAGERIRIGAVRPGESATIQ